jgi:hypothetical protein
MYYVYPGDRVAVETDHAAGRLQGLGFTVQLVPEALDVVHPIGDDDVIARQQPLDSRIFLGTRILLCLCGMVDVSRHAEGLIVDQVHLEATDACIGT